MCGLSVAKLFLDTRFGSGVSERASAMLRAAARGVIVRLSSRSLQEVRVNYELRELTVAGVIRSQDIGSDNTVHHDRMAEARIAYGGRGQLTYAQSPRYGQQLLDTLLPF